MSLDELSKRLEQIAQNLEAQGKPSMKAYHLRKFISTMAALERGKIKKPRKDIVKTLDEVEGALSHTRGLRDVYLEHIDRNSWDNLLLGTRDELVKFRRSIGY